MSPGASIPTIEVEAGSAQAELDEIILGLSPTTTIEWMMTSCCTRQTRRVIDIDAA